MRTAAIAVLGVAALLLEFSILPPPKSSIILACKIKAANYLQEYPGSSPWLTAATVQTCAAWWWSPGWLGNPPQIPTLKSFQMLREIDRRMEMVKRNPKPFSVDILGNKFRVKP